MKVLSFCCTNHVKVLIIVIPKVLICPITQAGFDFMVQNVEAGLANFDKILKIMTLFPIFT